MIKSVSIKPGCIACKNCESICPSHFKVQGKSMVINQNYKEEIQKIIKARDMCPVQVIDVELEEGVQISSQTFRGEVKEKRMLTPDTLELRIFAKESFTVLPGQYITLKMKDRLGTFVRSYSIVGYKKNEFLLTIKILEKGRGGAYLSQIKTKKYIEFFEPQGHFVLQNTPLPKVFIATGTGLAPMIYMLENTPKEVPKTVIFGARFEKDFYYQEVLASFENTQVMYCVSKPGEDFVGNKGRVTDYISEIDPQSEIYICGNPDMVESVREKANTLGIDEKNVFFESFVASPPPEEKTWFQNIIKEGNIPYLGVLEWIFILFGFATPFLIYFGPEWYYTTSWDVAWWSVVFVMLIRPLADIFPNIMMFRRLVMLRKSLGILSSSIILSQFGLNIYNYYVNFQMGIGEYFMTKYFIASKWSGVTLIPRASEITALLLFITSNTFSQKTFGIWWKRLQKLAYVYFFSAGYYIYTFGKEEALYCMIALVIVYIIALWRKR